MTSPPDKPRFSVDARIDALERQIAEQRMQAEIAKQDAIAAARMTAPEIRKKRKLVNWVSILLALVAIAVIAYFVFRPSAAPERGGLEDDGWSLPGVEPLPDAPELPDLEKLKQKQQTSRPRTGQTRKTAAPDLLDGLDGDTRDPTAGLPE